ncbi:MAG: ERCC4 domain-containing protein [Candidatus Hodarchaeales archaeon]
MDNFVTHEAEPRVYQQMIFSECVANSGNTLVILPTGLGKTVIMAYLAAYTLKKKPDMQILILTPTRPLVHQVKQMFTQFIGNLDPDLVLEVSGEVSPDTREKLYPSAKIIIGTPQTIENDVTYNRLDMKKIGLICVDEAHRATGDYAYVGICSQTKAQIVGFTATPGNNPEKIVEVCKNLMITKISVTDDKDYDVANYISTHTPKVVWIELPEEYKEVLSELESFQKELVSILKQDAKLRIDSKYLGKREALAIHQQIIGLTKQNSSFGEFLITTSNLIRVQHLKELVESQGFPQALKTIRKWQNKSSSKALSIFLDDPRIKNLEESWEKNPIIHPKLQHLISELKRYIGEDSSKDSRIIIFSNFRDTVRFLQTELEKAGFSSAIFLGHSSTKDDKGLTQREQIDVLDKFKKGEMRILLSTSVGEEGLDVGNCDLVVFYDSVPSVVRSVQRKGRGRKRKSKVIHLVTKGTRDESMYWAIKRKQSQMKRFLKRELPLLLSKNLKERSSPSLDKFLTKKKEKEEVNREIEEQQFVPKVIVDTRETSSKLPRLLKKMGAKLKPKELEVGDYVLSKRVVVEFKTYSDFIASILDGRLFKPKSPSDVSQLSKLSQQEVPIIVIQLEDEIQRQVHVNSIMGAISSIILDFKITVVFTRDYEETASFLYQIAKREQEKRTSAISLPTVSKKEHSIKEIQRFMLSAIPGINIQKANKLLEKFKSLSGISGASIDELSAVPSIGIKLATRIKDVFQEEQDGLDQ